MDPETKKFVSSKLQEMIESAAKDIPIPQKSSGKKQSLELVDKPVFFTSKGDMEKFLTNELEVTLITRESSAVHEEIPAVVSKEFILRASKSFEFHVYPGKQISKKKRVAAGTAVGSTTGGVACGVCGGATGAVLCGIAGAVIGTFIFPIIGTIIVGIGGAMAGAACCGAVGAGAGATTGAMYGGAAGGDNAEHQKRKHAVVVTAEDAFRSGNGYHADDNYVYCTVVFDGQSKEGQAE